MKKLNNYKNDRVFKMYGGANVTKSLDSLNNELKTTFDENIYFTKTIINEIEKLSTNNTDFNEKTKGQFDALNANLHDILTKIVEFKNKYESDVTNKQLDSSDQYINQVNTIQSFITETFNETSLNNYLTLKLSETPVFIKEQIDVGKITSSLTEIISRVSKDVNLLEINIKAKTIDGSQEQIENSIENINRFFEGFGNEETKIKMVTEQIEKLNFEFKNYMDVTLNDNIMENIIFVAPECVDKDMIEFSNAGSSKIENEKSIEDLNLLNKIDVGDLGKYLTDATILSSIVQRGGSSLIAQRGGSSSIAQRGGSSSIAQRGGSSSIAQRRGSSSIAQRGGSSSIAQRGSSPIAQQKRSSIVQRGDSDAKSLLNNLPFNAVDDLQNQTSKSLNDSVNDYYNKLIVINNKINNFKRIINDFKKILMEYNIRYIQVYNHLLFVVNYLKLIIMNKDSNYLIYQYLGRGTTTYYLRIIDRILFDIKNKKISSIGKYFYKYHYININILKKFLEFLNKNWKVYENTCTIIPEKKLIAGNISQADVKKKTLSKMYLLKSNYNPTIKKCIFIFNSMKDILDKYFSEFSPPVGIYLRINDWTPDKKQEDIVFAKNANNELGFIDKISLEKCKDSSGKSKSTITEIDKASKVKFQEVFDPEGFDTNEVLAKYMAIPSFLQEGKSIMLITYGYSGVGKTFTIFGSRNPQLDGVLQSSLSNIQQKKSLYYRAYEIYGLAVPYKLYWDKPPNEYHHFIYDYTNLSNPKTYDSRNMNSYLDDIKKSPKEQNSTFKELSEDLLKTFSDIVGEIDEKRKINGTIKRTINNRESSRSIMVYDFKVELNDNKFVNFVVMDLPGKEHITETFINPSPQNEYTCITIKENYGLDKDLLKKMAYFSPIALALNQEIAKMIITEYNKQRFDLIYNWKGLIKKKGYGNYDVINDIMKSLTDANNKDETRRYAIEIMRNIIQFNKFELLKSIYNNIFDYPQQNDNIYKSNPTEKYKCSTHNSYAITPFEGYYINENITGLISTLLKNLKLNNNFVQTQNAVYTNLFDNLVYERFYKNEPNNGDQITDNNLKELISQTYFFREFTQINNNQSNINDFYRNGTEYKGKNFKEWLGSDDIYDFNKSYRKDDPPIATILKPYFDIMNNFYVFYVVSNENKDKCEKQIKFIADSNDFLNELGNFNPEVYKKSKI